MAKKKRRTLKGRQARMLIGEHNRAGDHVHPGDLVTITRYRKDGSVDIYRPAARISEVSTESLELVDE